MWWLTVLSLLSGTLGKVCAIQVFPTEQNVQEVVADQEGSSSEQVQRESQDFVKLHHQFGVKVQHPFGQDHKGNILEQKEHHAFGGGQGGSQNQQSVFHPSQKEREDFLGEWKGINSFKKDYHENYNPNSELHQHQALGNLLQSLGQARGNFGSEQQMFGQVYQNYLQEQNNFNQQITEHQHFVNQNSNKNSAFQSLKHEESAEDYKSEPKILNGPTSSGGQNLRKEHFHVDQLKTDQENVLKPKETLSLIQEVEVPIEVPAPFTLEGNENFLIRGKFPMKNSLSENARKPYPFFLEKKVPYFVKEYVPQPYPVYRQIPHPVNIRFEKPHAPHITRPYQVLVGTKVPFHSNKQTAYPMRMYKDNHRPVPAHQGPLFKPIPYMPLERKHPYYVKVPVTKSPQTFSSSKPYKVFLENKMPYTMVEKTLPYPVRPPGHFFQHDYDYRSSDYYKSETPQFRINENYPVAEPETPSNLQNQQQTWVQQNLQL